MEIGLRENVYRLIRRQLLTGELPSGSRVSELALSKEFGTSRRPVREAIAQLIGEGFVEHIHNVGAYIREPSKTDVDELYQLRLWLEGEMAAEAARRIDAETAAELEQIRKQMRAIVHEHRSSGAQLVSSALLQRNVIVDMSFHRLLVRAGGNQRAMKIVGDHFLMGQIWFFYQQQYSLHNLARYYHEHTRIMRAVCRGDSEAARRHMRDHIGRGWQRTRQWYDRQHQLVADDKHPEENWHDVLREANHRTRQRQDEAERR